jgi:hypothetical protein
MRVLVGCERFGRVRDAFIALGHDAWSCDLVAAPGNHLQMDVFEAIEKHGPWDLGIFHPDCSRLCSSGLHRNKKRGTEGTKEALRFVKRLLDAPIEKIALENPVGCISTRIRPASQYIQPHEFGEDASKKTGIWLKNLPPLVPTKHIAPRIVQSGPYKGKKRWANQTDSGQNRLGPSETRHLDRAATYPGIADAFAQQWGGNVRPA